MALKKSISLPSGVDADYHRIGKMFADPAAPRVEVTFDVYLSKSARAAGKTAVDSYARVFRGPAAAALLAGNEFPTKGAIYTATKAEQLPEGSEVPDLSTATDV